jgi:DNA transformation protein and related proteins
MFQDEPVGNRFQKSSRISDLKNLGPKTEAHFTNIGITTALQFKKLGWKKTMEKLVNSNPKLRHSVYAYALIGALQNTDWNRISNEDKQAARAFCLLLKNQTMTKSRTKK